MKGSRYIMLIMAYSLAFAIVRPLHAQSVFYDPDSLIMLLMESGEWEEISLHPEILDELLSSGIEAVEEYSLLHGQDSLSLPKIRRTRVQQTLSIGFPSSGAEESQRPALAEVLQGNAAVPFSSRYRLKIRNPGKFEVRFLADQDASEPLRSRKVAGLPDHLSAGIIVHPGRVLKDLILGDLQANFGLGSILASTPSFTAIPGDPSLLSRPGTGVRLHPGTDENRHLRGLAGRVALKSLDIQFYLSAKRVDAALDTLSGLNGDSSLVMVDHLYGTGYHRTEAEIRGRESLGERSSGISLKYRGLSYEVGLAAAGFRYDKPLMAQTKWELVFATNTTAWMRTGAWFQWRLPVGILFAEASWSPGRAEPAWIAGFRMFSMSSFSASVRVSCVPPSYPVWYSTHQSGNYFTRGSTDLTGLYRYAPNRRFEMNGYFTARRDLWPGSNRKFAFPTSKMSHQIKYKVGESVLLTGMMVVSQPSELENLPEVMIFKIQMDSDPAQAAMLRFRAGIQNQRQRSDKQVVAGTTGDVSCYASFAGGRIRAIAGFRLFQVTSGMNPLYAYEPDLLYGWSAPVMAGSGSRWFFHLRYKPLAGLMMEGKVGKMTYTDAGHRTEGKLGGWTLRFQLVWSLQL